jgi:pseudaminic acid cytidylyltransferase
LKVVAIIPARGGSKRIPRKNIRLFNGLPMIAWSIQTAIKSGCFDRVIVSTDDEEIAKIANLYGAETPFIRPENLSDDYTTTSEVMVHAINHESSQGRDLDYVCCIYPTAPFITANNLKKGLKSIQSGNYEYVFSATTYAFPVERAFFFNNLDGLEMLFPENAKVRSQDLKDTFHDAGQFYWSRAHTWLKRQPIFQSNSFPLNLPRIEVVDIDTEEDWEEAEIKFKLLKKNPLQ